MNHLPFDWSDDVDDNYVIAHFVGGEWDGKSYVIPKLSEWRITVVPYTVNKPIEKLQHYIAVYKQIVVFGKEAVYWFSRTEKDDE